MRYATIRDVVLLCAALAMGAFMIGALAGCHEAIPQSPKVVTIPVRQACIDANDLPDAVPMTDLNGLATHDADTLAATNNLLRRQVAILMSLIVPACTK